MPKLRRGFQVPEILIVVSIIALLIGILIPAISKAREAASKISAQNQKSSQNQKQQLSQEEKEKLIQEQIQIGKQRAEQRRAEQLAKEAQEEQERLLLIEKEKQHQEILQREYLSQIQPLNFIVTPWQYNREQEFSVFVLYDITNKQEYLVVKTGLGTPNSSVSITPRYKNPNP